GILRALTARGTTILITTHVMEQIEALCDHLAIIANGKLLASDTMAGFRQAISGRDYTDLEHAFVALLGRDEPGLGLSWITAREP
ncbi:MAG: hypothetical protein ABI743_12470, partial [bacterium]